MDDVQGKIYSATPKNLYRYLESSRSPYIAINIKKKRIKLTEKIFNSNPISFSNQVHSLRKQDFPTPKKVIKKFNRPEDSSLDFPVLDELSFSPKIKEKAKSPKIEDISMVFSPKIQRNGILSNLSQIRLGDFEKNENIANKAQIVSGNFPVSFRVKKGRKASKSVSSTFAFEKLMIPVVEPTKIESLLKNSVTPTPEVKVPKYIRHQSFKAGYFLGKIDKMLNRIRVDRSKSSLNKYSLARNNLKHMIY